MQFCILFLKILIFFPKRERDLLLNSSNGIFLLLHNKILVRNPEDIGQHSRNALGKEGLFLHRIFGSSYKGTNEDICNLFLELTDWNLILNYINFVEKRTNSNYPTELLQSICSILNKIKTNYSGDFLKFLKKLTSLYIENIVKSSNSHIIKIRAGYLFLQSSKIYCSEVFRN